MGIPKHNVQKINEGFRFQKAVIQIIDWKRKKVLKEIEYAPPKEHLGKDLSIQFKGAYIYGIFYYVVTNTEVLCYNLNTWILEDIISLPCFNDLHGVMRKDDLLYIVNTGLEVIQVFDLKKRKIINEYNMASTPTYERFDPYTDYRQIATTKPHEAHVNHVFNIDDNIWATRGQKRDAISLDSSDQIELPPSVNGEKIILCHDGIIRFDKLYFTTVDAHIIAYDPTNKELLDDLDVRKINNTKYNLGWTRGLEIVGENAFLGLSKMRPTTFKQYTSWFVRNKKNDMPSSIIQIDMNKTYIEDYYIMENYKGHAIFTILKHPDSN